MQETAPSSRIILTVEGNIGAGKSTFLKILSQKLPVDIVYEPTDKWQEMHGDNLLDLFYKDTQRWAYTFQSYAFISRIQAQNKSLAERSVHSTQVLERSVYCDRYCFAQNCYEMGVMSGLEWHIYTEWFSWLVESYTTKPHGFIYLQTDPATCMERMQKRNRSEEVGVSLEYLTLLHKRHEEWLVQKHNVVGSTRDIPVLILPCNDEFEQNYEVQVRHIEAVRKFIAQLNNQNTTQTNSVAQPGQMQHSI